MQKVVWMAALLLLATGCSEENKTAPKQPVQAASPEKTAFVAESAAEKTILTGCVKTVQQQASGQISRAAIDKLCLCSLSTLRKKYSVAQLEALDKKKVYLEAYMRDAVDAGRECAVKLRDGQL